MTLSSIEPIYGHVPNGAEDVDEEEDGAYGYVLMDVGTAADTRKAVRDVRRLQTIQSASLAKRSW